MANPYPRHAGKAMLQSCIGCRQEIAMPKTFETFKSVALAEGFDEVLERVRAPDTVLEEHTER